MIRFNPLHLGKWTNVLVSVTPNSGQLCMHVIRCRSVIHDQVQTEYGDCVVVVVYQRLSLYLTKVIIVCLQILKTKFAGHGCTNLAIFVSRVIVATMIPTSTTLILWPHTAFITCSIKCAVLGI